MNGKQNYRMKTEEYRMNMAGEIELIRKESWLLKKALSGARSCRRCEGLHNKAAAGMPFIGKQRKLAVACPVAHRQGFR